MAWIVLGLIGIVAVWLLASRVLVPQAPAPATESIAVLSTTLPAEAIVPTATIPELPTIVSSGVVTATSAPTPKPSSPKTQMTQDQTGAITVDALTIDTWTPLPPTSTPIARSTRAVEVPPTQSPTLTKTPSPAPPTPTQISPTPQQTTPPTLAPTPAKPGLILDFETFGTWERGNEPYGAFAPSKEQAHEGAGSGKLTYDFPAVDNNYVVFLRRPAAPIPGEPQTLTAWVYGDGSNLFLNAWIQDSEGEVRQFSLGRIQHTDSWQPMALTLDAAAPWPQGHISGTDNNEIDYPVSLVGFVLDAEGSAAKSGQIFIDELIVGGTTATPIGAAGTPTPASSEATPTSNPTPVTALSGRIAYTSDGDIMAVDVSTRTTWQIAPNARQPDIAGPWVLANGSGGGRDNVFVASVSGGGERITGMHPEDAYPSWSPSARSAAFSSTIIDGQERLYVQWDMIHQEEPAMVKVGGADVFGRNPTWMDNGRIAFTGCNYWAEGSNCGIWAVAGDDSEAPYRLTDQADDVSSDSFGGNLLYQSRAAGNWDIYLVPTAGGTSRNLTNSPSQDAGAAFSPDGRAVAFMSDRDGSWGIWIIGLDGGNPQKVLAVPGGFGADWPNERLSWSE